MQDMLIQVQCNHVVPAAIPGTHALYNVRGNDPLSFAGYACQVNPNMYLFVYLSI